MIVGPDSDGEEGEREMERVPEKDSRVSPREIGRTAKRGRGKLIQREVERESEISSVKSRSSSIL